MATWHLNTDATAFLVAAAFAVLAASLLPLAPPGHAGTAYLALHSTLTILMIWALARSEVSFETVLAAGIILRLGLFWVAPIFSSNDYERYLWDGAVLLAGIDPYSVPANDPAVADLRALWPTPVEHEAYATIYPPGALYLYALCATAGPSLAPFTWKTLTLLASLASLSFMADMVRRRGLERYFALFAISPLLLLEIGLGVHVDVFSVLAITAGLALLDRRKPGIAASVLALGGAVKLLPLLVLAPLVWYAGFRRGAKMAATGAITFLGVYASAFALGLLPIGVVGTFFEKWRHGSPVFAGLEWFLDTQALVSVLAVMALVFLVAAFRDLLAGDPIRSALWLLATPLLLSPVVFPWYLVVLVPLTVLRPSITLCLWLSVAPASHEVLNGWLSPDRNWSPAVWPLWAISGALIVGVVADMCLRWYRPRAQREALVPSREPCVSDKLGSSLIVPTSS